MTLGEIQAQYPEEYPKYLEKDLSYAPKGGETTRDVSIRMASIIGESKPNIWMRQCWWLATAVCCGRQWFFF
ncbi:MAG: hypothetical protein Ct9H300mP11_25540 [Chloroflexota bacterium]|nr:MAG: hypothetical protein Ct9H300mP11_25540 [Chloroflexota bacterium]